MSYVSTRILAFAAIVFAGTLAAPSPVAAANPFAEKAVEIFRDLSRHVFVHAADQAVRPREASSSNQTMSASSTPLLNANVVAAVRAIVAAQDADCARNLNCSPASDARYMPAQLTLGQGPTSPAFVAEAWGLCYASGDCAGVPRDLVTARDRFRTAASYGNADAITHLGMMCAVGLGGPADRPCVWRAGLIADVNRDSVGLYKLGLIDPDPSDAALYLIRSMDYGNAAAKPLAQRRCLEVPVATGARVLASCNRHHLI